MGRVRIKKARGKGLLCPHCELSTMFWFDDGNFFLFVCFHCWEPISIPLELYLRLEAA